MIEICKDAFSNCQLSFIVCLLLLIFGLWLVYEHKRLSNLINMLEGENK